MLLDHGHCGGCFVHQDFHNELFHELTIVNDFVTLKLLSVASTRFASVLVMLKIFKLIKGTLQSMVISERWNSHREDNVGKAKFGEGEGVR